MEIIFTDERQLESTSIDDTVTYCRSHCYSKSSNYALLRSNHTCACTDNFVDGDTHNACKNEEWYVYRVSQANYLHGIVLEAWSRKLTSKSYSRPGEDVAFYAALNVNINSTFKFTFDETTVVTSHCPVYHSFISAGVYEVNVSTQVGLIYLETNISVRIQDVDEGKRPNKVFLTSYHRNKSFEASYALVVVDEHNSTCSIRFGDNSTLTSLSVKDFEHSTNVLKNYRSCGKYEAEAECSNVFGKTKNSTAFVAKQLETYFYYHLSTEDVILNISGDTTFLTVK